MNYLPVRMHQFMYVCIRVGQNPGLADIAIWAGHVETKYYETSSARHHKTSTYLTDVISENCLSKMCIYVYCMLLAPDRLLSGLHN